MSKTIILVKGTDEEMLGRIWPKVHDLLHANAEYFFDTMPIEQMLECIKNETMQLWVMIDDTGESILLKDVAITDLTPLNAGLTLNTVVFVGSETLQDHRMFIQIEDWARDHGAVMSITSGRFGWKKVLGKLGYTGTRVVYHKSLLEDVSHVGR